MADFSIGIGIKQFLGKAKAELSSFTGQATQSIGKIGSAITNAAGTAVLASFAGLSLALAGSAVAAVRFENEFANVKKTMSDVEDPEVFKGIQEDLVKLSTQIPIFAGELAGIAAVGGQLGIGAQDISQFTEVVAKLGGATNMTSEQAATGMARFLNVTNEQMDTIGKFASVLVELGNNTAATEGEILLLAQNFGATGEITGLATEEILAFSAAMRETGQQSQAGATALGKLFLNLSDAAKIGGKEMAVFAEVAGKDVHEFRRLIETDIGSAAQVFLGGLNRMTEDGRSTTATLEELGLGTIRVQRALLSLANNEEGLAEARRRANDEAISQNALNEEAAQKFDTVSMKMTQFKSSMGAAAITLGQALMPLLHVLADVLVNVANGFVAFAEVLAETPGLLFTLTGVLGVLSTVYLVSVGKNLASVLGVLGKFTALLTVGGGIIAAVGFALYGLGRAFKAFKESVEEANKVSEAADAIMDKLKLSLDEGFKVNPIDEETWIAFTENLPEAVRKSVVKGVEEGMLGPDVFNAITSSVGQLPKAFSDNMKDILDIDEGFFEAGDLDVAEITKTIDILKNSNVSGQLSPMIEALEEYQSLIGKSGKENKARKEELLDILRIQFEIFDGAEAEARVRNEDISEALNNHFGTLVKTDKRLRDMMSTEAGRLKLAKELASKGMPEFIELLGGAVDASEDLNENFDQTAANLDSLLRIVNDFRTQIDNLFAPTEAQFKAMMNERDLADAHKEHADLHKEQSDLTQEELDLAQEKLDLANADLRTSEEKLEMQELENEALEIEKRIREGMALSANDQLRKEKLKKELARVNAAAAQGSLEFADLEKKAIQEQIAEIDGKALTQADADDKRAKAQKIVQTAEERRLERLAEIDGRRVEIQERLAEIPGEILEAHYDIHKLQRDSVNTQLDMIQAQAEFQTLKEKELKTTAELLGLNMAQIDGLMTLMNHLRVESGPGAVGYMNKVLANLPSLQALLGYDGGNSLTGPEMEGLFNAFNTSGRNYGNMKPQFKHIGGAFKGGRNYVVGEYGPEMMKAFPGGGGMITPMGNRGSGNTTNHVTLNVTGLPSDPIAARRTAQVIQKELNKLKGDGRSGVVR